MSSDSVYNVSGEKRIMFDPSEDERRSDSEDEQEMDDIDLLRNNIDEVSI